MPHLQTGAGPQRLQLPQDPAHQGERGVPFPAVHQPNHQLAPVALFAVVGIKFCWPLPLQFSGSLAAGSVGHHQPVSCLTMHLGGRGPTHNDSGFMVFLSEGFIDGSCGRVPDQNGGRLMFLLASLEGVVTLRSHQITTLSLMEADVSSLPNKRTKKMLLFLFCIFDLTLKITCFCNIQRDQRCMAAALLGSIT